jgi:hypothetical protein
VIAISPLRSISGFAFTIVPTVSFNIGQVFPPPAIVARFVTVLAIVFGLSLAAATCSAA